MKDLCLASVKKNLLPETAVLIERATKAHYNEAAMMTGVAAMVGGDDDAPPGDRRLERRDDRRLEDYYAFEDTIKQHPWYSHTMLIVLAALVLISIGYGLYQIYFRTKEDCNAVCNKTKIIESTTEGAKSPRQIEMTDGPSSSGQSSSSAAAAQQQRQGGYVNMSDDPPMVTKGVAA